MRDEQIKKIIYESTPIDEILKIIDLRDGFEVIGRAGGDVLKYRIYKNETIVEK